MFEVRYVLVTNSDLYKCPVLTVIPLAEGKRSMMKLAQRMVNNFCSSINPANGQQWTTNTGLNEFEVRATLHKSTDSGKPNGMVLSAAATIWLPIPPQNVFNFFRDERTRPQVSFLIFIDQILMSEFHFDLTFYMNVSVGCSIKSKSSSRSCSHCKWL